MPNSRQLRLNGSNFADGNANDPSPTGDNNHGNACAGVIAATMNNNQGIAGIASECKIMPIRIFNSDGSGILPDSLANAIQFAVDNGANILSNSWGYPTSDQNAHPVIVTAINYALDSNRVVIFAAGNNARHYSCNDNGYVTFPANVNIPGVITVGASDRNDNQSDYSPTSSLIDIVAPSHRAYPPAAYSPQCGGISGETFEMWSIDIPENSGYNPWPADGTHPPTTGEILPNTGTNYRSYTGRFGGTSHSCPVIAGVAALILSVNSNLSYMDVFNILTNTANKVGGFTYSNGRCNQMGYGRVNAYAALNEVLTQMDLYVSGPTSACSGGTIFTINNLPSVDSIIWNTGPYLTVSSGQNTDSCTISATGNGESWVQVRLVNECGSITLPRKIVWAGTPHDLELYCEGRGDLYTYAFYVTPFYDGDSIVWGTVPAPAELTDLGYGYATIRFDEPGIYDIWAYVENECGPGTPAYITDFYVYDFLMSPNPASTEVEITISAGPEEGIKNASLTSGDEFTVTILDNYGIAKIQKKYFGKKFTVPVSSLKDGTYFVRVNHGKMNATKQLIIKR